MIAGTTHIAKSPAMTSYGGYSGCPPNEKVTWHKLDPDTENYTVNSDASIVAPLIFKYVLEKAAQANARIAKKATRPAEQGRAEAVEA